MNLSNRALCLDADFISHLHLRETLVRVLVTLHCIELYTILCYTGIRLKYVPQPFWYQTIVAEALN